MTPSQSTFKPVPIDWVQKLFDRMTALYGPRLMADVWHGVKLEEVHSIWAAELGKLSSAQLGAGVQTLADAFQRPPTLPQLMAHCRTARQQQQATAPQLTDQRRADPKQYAANMERVKDAAKPKRPNGVAWAWRLLERGTGASGQALTPEVIRVAESAIERYGRKGGKNDE